jgi:hypothetical protein
MKTVIEATKISPRVEFNSDGELSFHGRSIIEDTTVFFMPIIDWVKSLTCSKITVVVRMEYMNTSSSKQLLTVLKALASNPFLETINVKWFYEEDDEDMLDMGKDYESLIQIPFDFFELSGEIV